MKMILSLFAVALMTAASVHAKEDEAKKQEMMKSWMEYSTPGEAHKTLAKMAGNWKYTSSFWETQDGKPETSSGTSKMKMILDGRFLQHDFKGKAMGQPFQGLGITGYDNIKKKYDTVWLDSMATGIMHGTGIYDADSKVLTDAGTASCPMTPSKTRNYRSEWKIIDQNKMTFTMWGPDLDGKEFKNMEMVFTRAK